MILLRGLRISLRNNATPLELRKLVIAANVEVILVSFPTSRTEKRDVFNFLVG